MAKRLTVQEKTRREIKAWLGQHGFWTFLSGYYSKMTIGELRDIVEDVIEFSIQSRWETYITDKEVDNS